MILSSHRSLLFPPQVLYYQGLAFEMITDYVLGHSGACIRRRDACNVFTRVYIAAHSKHVITHSAKKSMRKLGHNICDYDLSRYH